MSIPENFPVKYGIYEDVAILTGEGYRALVEDRKKAWAEVERLTRDNEHLAAELVELRALEMNHEGACERLTRERDESDEAQKRYWNEWKRTERERDESKEARESWRQKAVAFERERDEALKEVAKECHRTMEAEGAWAASELKRDRLAAALRRLLGWVEDLHDDDSCIVEARATIAEVDRAP